MPKRLKLRLLSSVSLVDRGDNKGADVLIHKRADGPEPDPGPSKSGDKERSWLLRTLAKFLGEDGDAVSFTEAGQERDISDDIWELTYRLEESLRSIMGDDDVTDKAATVSESLDQFTSAVNNAVPVWLAGGSVTKEEGEEMPEDIKDLAGAIDVDELPEEMQGAFKALIDRVAELEEAAKEEPAEPADGPSAKDGEGEAEPAAPELGTDEILGALREALAKTEGDEGEPEEVDEAVAKALDGVEERIAKAEAEAKEKAERAEELEGRLDTIEKNQRRQKFIKMANDLDALPDANADDLAAVLDKIEGAVEEEEFGQLTKVLSGANEAAQQVLKTVGSDGESDGDTAMAELNKRAEAQMEANPDLTPEKARRKVMDEDAALRDRVLNEEESAWG